MKKFQLDNNNFINYKQQEFGDNSSPTIVYLHGLLSDMKGNKVLAIENHCKIKNYNFFAFDNLGHGTSSGIFTECNISAWVSVSFKIIKEFELNNVILVGSSMGAWLSLILAEKKLISLKSTLLIAPAPDFTETIWENLNDLEKEVLDNNGIVNVKETLDFAGIPVTKNLIEDGKKNLLLNKDEIIIDYPISIVHGMEDKDVSYNISETLTKKIKAPYVTSKFLKYSGHRLSEPQDIKVILNTIDELAEIC